MSRLVSLVSHVEIVTGRVENSPFPFTLKLPPTWEYKPTDKFSFPRWPSPFTHMKSHFRSVRRMATASRTLVNVCSSLSKRKTIQPLPIPNTSVQYFLVLFCSHTFVLYDTYVRSSRIPRRDPSGLESSRKMFYFVLSDGVYICTHPLSCNIL